MPQMSSLNWMVLVVYFFIIILMVMIMMSYKSNLLSEKVEHKGYKEKKFNMKW